MRDDPAQDTIGNEQEQARSADDHAAPRRVLSFRRFLLASAIFCAVFGGIMVLAVVHLVGVAPTWWRTVDPNDPVVIADAERIESAIVAAMHRTDRDPDGTAPEGVWRSEPWGVAISEDHASAWLSVRLRQWIEHEVDGAEWPESVRELQVKFDDGMILIGVRLQDGSEQRLLSATVSPSLERSGTLWVTLDEARLGRLPLPSGWILAGAREQMRATAAAAGDESLLPMLVAILAGDAPLARDAEIRLSDGRRVRLLGLRAKKGRLEVVCRTELQSGLAAVSD